MDSKEYEKQLAQKILSFAESLRPTNAEHYIREEGKCPACNCDEYFYLPEFGYGRCNNCPHEVGLASFHKIIEAREIVYKNVMKKLKDTLE